VTSFGLLVQTGIQTKRVSIKLILYFAFTVHHTLMHSTFSQCTTSTPRIHSAPPIHTHPTPRMHSTPLPPHPMCSQCTTHQTHIFNVHTTPTHQCIRSARHTHPQYSHCTTYLTHPVHSQCSTPNVFKSN